MSHVAEIELEVRDLDALAEASRRLGLEFVQGQETYRWYGATLGDYPLPAGFTAEDLGRCEHAIRLPPGNAAGREPYEIGVVRRRDGRPGYSLLWDFWMGGFGLQEKVGAGCARLRQEYAAETTRREARRQGFGVQEQLGADGMIRLRLTR
jgi:hypothetical protein